MTEALNRLREAVAKRTTTTPLLTPFVGTGFSLAATGGAGYASWSGLLLEGIKVCQRVGTPMPPGWPDRMREQLDNADVFTYLAVADEVARRLRAVRGGREFGTWLQSTVGRLEATEPGMQIINAVCSLGKVIVTTNYDTVIEKAKKGKNGWYSYTWKEDGYGAHPPGQKVVLHMHGVAEDPDSIILSSADYQRYSDNELSKVFNQSLFGSRRFIFIGCGDGLNDPNISTLMEFAQRVFDKVKESDEVKSKAEHYLLVPGSQLRQFNEHPISPLIVPVAYGSGFDELTPFLQNLLADEATEASQDPDEYDRHAAARPRTALLDLAEPAWEKLQAVRDALQRAARRMEQVENRGAAPDGMTDWDLRDQKSVHEQLAASLRGPAKHLEACLVEVVSGFKDADPDVGRLRALTKFAADLNQMTDMVSELEGQTWQLRDRLAAAVADLRERAERYGGYGPPRDTLINAYRFLEEAHTLASSLKEDLDQLQADAAEIAPATESPERKADLTADAEPVKRNLQVVRDTAPAKPRGTAEPDPPPAADAPTVKPGEVAGTSLPIPVLGEIAAGELTLPNDENIRGYLALPDHHLRGREVYLLEVKGDSMTGEDDVLEGDYVVVDHGASWSNGDMVVVFVEGEGATLKRIWRDRASVFLQPSNPAHEPIILRPGVEPHYQGKVIGVIRWRISTARRRRRPSR
jgi:SOS-response transcriptional repressor LexA